MWSTAGFDESARITPSRPNFHVKASLHVAASGRRTKSHTSAPWLMAGSLWLTVATGTLMVYPTYRAQPPAGTVELAQYPRWFLLADPSLAGWHQIGMEWKEHIAWLAPILATTAAFVVTRYRSQLAEDAEIRRAAILLFTLAFISAGIAGLLGALINKAAPIP